MAKLNANYGYGQVEPNHLSAQRTGQIYAQLPVADAVMTSWKQLENGTFLKYDYASKTCNLTGEGEWFLVFNEVKTYDVRQSYKHFAMFKDGDVNPQLGGKVYPRLFKTNVGDIFTTNNIEMGATTTATAKYVSISNGILTASATKPSSPDGGILFAVAQAYSMADGSPALKLQRIA